MRHFSPGVALLLLLLVLVPAQSAAAEPERLLAADSLVYLRFDGVDAHRKAYEQTALGELMQGDLGNLIQYLIEVSRDSLGPVLAKGELLQGSPTERLRNVREGFNHLSHALNHLARHGVAVGVEVGEPLTLRIQLTLVFPGGGEAKNRDALFAIFRLATALGQSKVKEEKVAGRTVYTVTTASPVRIAWWQEGGDVAFVVGTAGAARAIALADGKEPNLLTNPLYKSLVAFKKYETAARGFVDFARAGKVVRAYYPPTEAVRARLGLANLEHLTFHVGFEGRSQRSTAVLQVPGRRQGLLAALAAQQQFELEQLPPLPPDVTAVYANHFDLAALYDTVVRAIAGGIEAGKPNEKEEAEEVFKKIDQALGIDVRKDLLASLGSLTVLYNAPAEGPLSLGYGLALQVKDAGKLKEALTALFQSLPAALGADISIKPQTYRGVETHILRYAQQGFFLLPSYTIHNGWLVIGLYPQTVQGYILRSGGKHEVWKPTALTRDVLAAAKTEGGKPRLISLSVSDLRPTLRQLCTIAPLIGGMANSFAPNSFDVSRLPNSQAITDPLFPNVSVFVDDGDSLRLEAHSSLALPILDLAGMDTYFTALLGFQLVRFGF